MGAFEILIFGGILLVVLFVVGLLPLISSSKEMSRINKSSSEYLSRAPKDGLALAGYFCGLASFILWLLTIIGVLIRFSIAGLFYSNILWLLTIIGVLISLLGIGFSIAGLSSNRRKLATWGLILAIVGLILSVFNMLIGYPIVYAIGYALDSGF